MLCISLPFLSNIDCGCLDLLLGCLFYSICMYLFQYHTTVIIVALQHCLKSGRVVHPVLFYSLSIALAILDFLWFNLNLRITCSSSVNNVMGYLIGATLNL